MRIANEIDGAAGSCAKNLWRPAKHATSDSPRPTPGRYFYQPLIQFHSGEQLGRGLYGAIIVDEPHPVPTDAELILILSDWRLDASGADRRRFRQSGRRAAAGSLWRRDQRQFEREIPPLTYPPGARLRLRLVNASNARMLDCFSIGAAPTIIARRRSGSATRSNRCAIPSRSDPARVSTCCWTCRRQEGQKIRLILARRNRIARCRGAGVRDQGAARPAPAPPPRAATPIPCCRREIPLQAAKRFEIVIEGGAQKTTPGGIQAEGRRLAPHLENQWPRLERVLTARRCFR